jgi:hypothetical protein
MFQAKRQPAQVGVYSSGETGCRFLIEHFLSEINKRFLPRRAPCEPWWCGNSLPADETLVQFIVAPRNP